MLLKILNEKKILGSDPRTAFIHGARRAVCFQDAPLLGLAQNVRFEADLAGKGPRRYEGIGIAFTKRFAYEAGARPVLYENPTTATAFLREPELWRLVRLELTGATAVDWMREREWRCLDDFVFELNRCSLIVEDSRQYCALLEKARLDLLKQVRGITVVAHATA